MAKFEQMRERRRKSGVSASLAYTARLPGTSHPRRPRKVNQGKLRRVVSQSLSVLYLAFVSF
ncbi:hypothetical protein OBBRIDRAFT_792835 [Obba rivulosa]|uniref:Uncharacterized protein n=1 Tax=Obba rivulosa TaxID=1052685 RepID=A0A8E2AZ73_9APHY|nr:hypothetical protein OBBRIDRAFT_792835 [Obba rivulosa]